MTQIDEARLAEIERLANEGYQIHGNVIPVLLAAVREQRETIDLVVAAVREQREEIARLTKLARELAEFLCDVILTYNKQNKDRNAILDRPDVAALLNGEAPKGRTCRWTTDDNGFVWKTSCGFCEDSYGTFCTNCGRPVAVEGATE